jgi:tetratricopeptide (TPR) repeat protein
VTWNNQAECLLGIGHWLEARSISEKGAHAATRVGYIPAKAHAYVNTALICLALGDLSAANDWLARSRDLFELFDSPTHKWITLRGLGQVAEARGKLALAASCYRASRIAGEAGGIRCVAHSLIAMARVARLSGRIALADTARNEADVLLRGAPTGDWADLLRAALALEEGKHQMVGDNWEAAARCFAHATSLSLNVSSEPAEASIVRIQATIADGLRALGQASKGSGDIPLLIEQAKALLDNGMRMARESGHYATILSAQFARAEFSLMIGDRENAHLLAEHAHALALATGYAAWVARGLLVEHTPR